MAGSQFSREFFELIKSIGESKSKQEEDRIILQEMGTLKEQLGSKVKKASGKGERKAVAEFLIRCIYVEMLGHDASFGYLKAVELCASGNLLQKRVAYLTAGLCFAPEHEFRIMLVNRLQKDMQSSNVLEVCSALSAATRLLTVDMAPAVTPLFSKLLSHEQAIVRKKTVMLIHRFLQLDPALVADMGPTFRRVLMDRDPSVMSASLHIFHDLAKVDPLPLKDLVPSFVSILKQVAEHKLPRDFEYHRVPAPWIQIKLLRILSLLGRADQRASEQMYEVVAEVMRRADTGVTVGYAIVYETVRTVTSLYPSTSLLDGAAAAIARFLSADNPNLRYLGVTGLAAIVTDHPKYAASHQMAVIDCLSSPDETLVRKTLDLLFRMTNPVNVTVIVDKLLEHLKKASDRYLRADLVERICRAAERFAPSNLWFISTMVTVFELGGDLVKPETADALVRLVAEGAGDEDEDADAELRREAVESLLDLSERPSLPDVLVSTMCWVLGEYGYLAESLPLPAVTERVVALAGRAGLGSAARAQAVAAVMKLTAQLGALLPPAASLLDRYAAARDADLSQRCREFSQLASTMPLMRQVLPVDASLEDISLPTGGSGGGSGGSALPFLDAFVSEALAAGARAYKPPAQGSSGGPSLVAADGGPGLKFDAYEDPEEAAAAALAAAGGTDDGPSGVDGFDAAEISFEPASGPWGRAGFGGKAGATKDDAGGGGSGAAVDAGAADRIGAALGGLGGAGDAPAANRSTGPSSTATGAPSRAPKPKPVDPAEEERKRQAALLFGGIGGGDEAPLSVAERKARERAERRARRAGGAKPVTAAASAATAPPTGPTAASADDDEEEVDLLGGGGGGGGSATGGGAGGGDSDAGGDLFGGTTMVAPTTTPAAAKPTPPTGALTFPPVVEEWIGTTDRTAPFVMGAGPGVRVAGVKAYRKESLVLLVLVTNTSDAPLSGTITPSDVPFLAVSSTVGSPGVTIPAAAGGGVGRVGELAGVPPRGSAVMGFRFVMRNIPTSTKLAVRVAPVGGAPVVVATGLPLSDLLRAAPATTAEFGAKWTAPAYRAQEATTVRMTGGGGGVPGTLPAFAEWLSTTLRLHPIESIPRTQESIAAAQLMGTTQWVLLHAKLGGGDPAAEAKVTVKTANPQFSAAVAALIRTLGGATA